MKPNYTPLHPAPIITNINKLRKKRLFAIGLTFECQFFGSRCCFVLTPHCCHHRLCFPSIDPTCITLNFRTKYKGPKFASHSIFLFLLPIFSFPSPLTPPLHPTLTTTFPPPKPHNSPPRSLSLLNPLEFVFNFKLQNCSFFHFIEALYPPSLQSLNLTHSITRVRSVQLHLLRSRHAAGFASLYHCHQSPPFFFL